jgi:plastocyanin
MSGGMMSGGMMSGGMMSGGMSDMMAATSTMMASASTMMASASTMMAAASTMTTASAMATSAYSAPSYGSGNSNWGGSGYNNCVQQCMASYGSMGTMSAYTPSSTASMGSSGGNGVTHTVIVAPTQGVLRYVPFATNASVGDTVRFMWGANNHTVTKSSQLQLCNKTSDAPFASGEQNKTFTFDQVVNDTQPIFYYCGTPTHCEKGMFGIINPPMASSSSNSVAGMMPAMAQNSSSMAAMSSYTNMMTMNNTMAANWGSGMDMSAMPSWAQSYMAENIMYTRTMIAANPDMMDSNGNINMNTSSPMMVPPDITQAANNAANSSSSSSTSTATSSSSPSTSASPATAAKNNGARSLGSSGALVGFVAVLGAFLAL